jgi:hypothetical protein
MLSHLILNLIDRGHRLFPIDGRKVPMIKGWQTLASCDRAALEAWRQHWAHCGFGLCLSEDLVVTDYEMRIGENGLADFRRLHGCDPHDVITPFATSPTGGGHLYWATNGRRYKNARLPGTSIDCKCKGGFVGVPDVIDGIGNGRQYLRTPWEVPLLPAPAWLDVALREQEPTRLPAAMPMPLSDDPDARRQGRAALKQACRRIVAAQPGERDNVRHRECYTIGGLIARGDVDEKEAFDALLDASLKMQAKGHGWRDLERRVAASLAAGIKRPLPLSEIEQWMRHWRGQIHA